MAAIRTYGRLIAKKLFDKADNELGQIKLEYNEKIRKAFNIRTKMALAIQRIHKCRKQINVCEALYNELQRMREYEKTLK